MSSNRLSMRAALLLAAASLMVHLGSARSAPPSGTPGQCADPVSADPRAQLRTYHMDDANIDVPYWVFTSSKVSPNKPAPLIVSLHGWGVDPQIMCNESAVNLAEAGGYILAAPLGYSRFGWYGSPVISLGAATPPSPSDQQIRKWSEEDVMNVLAMMRKDFNVDPKRIYLTGHSMGGAGALFLASTHADIWAAVAPVAPATLMLNPSRDDILAKIKAAGIPVLIVQGGADTVVAAANTRLWVQSAKELGLDCTYIELPGMDHGPVITASQKYIYAFFGEHSKR